MEKCCIKSGFSLVELSIVLVILGLLTGGILAGQSLIRASELRSVSSDVQRYVAATNTFRDKYFALPGDMRNATSFWGIAAGTGSDATCAAFQSTTAATCNGDGNGIIAAGGAPYQEEYRFWQHLGNAGLIEGHYNGARNAVLPYPTLGANSPRAKISNTGFGVAYVLSTSYLEGYWGTQSIGNTLFFGRVNDDIVRGAGALKPEESWNIDTKMDDGLPDQGWVQGDAKTSTCFTASSSPSNYALASNVTSCVLKFYLR